MVRGVSWRCQKYSQEHFLLKIIIGLEVVFNGSFKCYKMKKGSPKDAKKVISHLKNNKYSSHDKTHKRDTEKGENKKRKVKKKSLTL